MGKGNRNDRQKIENQSANEAKFFQKKKAQESKTRSDRIIAAACIVIALVVVAILVLNVFSETGVFMRMQPIMKQGDMVVDQAMMTFFANDYIGNWYTNYIDYVYSNYYYFMLGYYPEASLNLTQDIRTQKITSSDVTYYINDNSYLGRSWYDYFYDQIVSQMERNVTYANAAKQAGLSLSSADLKEIDEIVKAIADDCKKSGVSISEVYGKGVSESDIRKCYELIYLAGEFEEYKTAKIKDYLSTAEGKDEINKYPDSHKADYYSAKYLSHTEKLSAKNFKTQEDFDNAVKELKAAMDKISKAENLGHFVDLIEEYKKNPVETGNKETTSESGSKAETESETKAAESETVNLIDKYTGSIKYETDDELGKWLFDESEPAQKGDVKVIEEEGTETETVKKGETSSESESESELESDVKNSKAGGETNAESDTDTEKETGSSGNSSNSSTKSYATFKITVYMVLSPSALDTSNTHNFGYVVTNDRGAAVKFLAAFKSLDKEERTRDKFKEMAEEYYNKHFAEHDHTEEEHVEPLFTYDSVFQGKESFFKTNFGSDFAKFDTWLDSADRIQDGDEERRKYGEIKNEYVEVTVGSGDSKETYYAVFYFEAHHSQAWYVDAFADLLDEQFAKWYEEELKNSPVEFDEKDFDDIQIVKYAS